MTLRRARAITAWGWRLPSARLHFRLVTMPITVASATEDHSIRFHQYHLEDMGRVRVREYCEIEDREVDQGEIGKGYQLTKEQVIPFSDEELRDLPLPTAKAFATVAFVPLDSVAPLKIGEGYCLAPSGQVAAKPYKLNPGEMHRMQADFPV
ncbi:Ku protein [Streptomyces afghaniensis]|uniref:Ku protein n=1 Tax=Streptomyces afghaniensis TaxID=66865 RepID=UPI0033B7358D